MLFAFPVYRHAHVHSSQHYSNRAHGAYEWLFHLIIGSKCAGTCVNIYVGIISSDLNHEYNVTI